ncbi:MAG TPA: aldose 1-epimerase family protein [Streptosporangiales bacterium]
MPPVDAPYPVRTPSGRQFTIGAGPYAATVTEVGATIRTCTWNDLPLVAGFPADAICDGGHGQLLAPWPNRVDRGRYEFRGASRQLDLTEPDKDNAIHGLVRWEPWHCQAHEESRVTLAHRLYPKPGYPHVLDLRVNYALDASGGLAVETTVANAGTEPAPWGTGQHPYLTPGTESVRECTLRLPASSYLVVDDRMIPLRSEPVEGTPYDFRTGRVIGTTPLDPPFGDLARDGDGRAVAEVVAPDGARATLWCDEAYRWLQVFTGHTLAPYRRFQAIAVEPMSCPPDAFNSGRDLVVLEPGESWTGRWGLAFTPAP